MNSTLCNVKLQECEQVKRDLKRMLLRHQGHCLSQKRIEEFSECLSTVTSQREHSATTRRRQQRYAVVCLRDARTEQGSGGRGSRSLLAADGAGLRVTSARALPVRQKLKPHENIITDKLRRPPSDHCSSLLHSVQCTSVSLLIFQVSQ